MDRILSSIPLYVLIPVGIFVLVLLAVLIAKAFYEGREISFWPPKIGPRPNQEKIEGTTTGGVTKLKNSVAASKYDTRLTSEPLEPRRVSILNDKDISSIRSLEVIAKTNHSVIEKCIYKGEYYVLKKTDEKVCQPEALAHLVGKEFVGYGGPRATITTPMRVWVQDNYVWELHPFYDGITLLDLIKRSKFRLRGELLGKILNVLIRALSQLHEEGILHRDIAPSNILMTDSGDLLVLDCSFCCRMDSEQTPVGNSTYTAPEQLAGQATYQSDWYSVAATIFFLANGFPPERHPERFKAGLGNIDVGSLSVPYEFHPRTGGVLGMQKSVPKLIESLLEPKVSDRPEQQWEVVLDESTIPVEFYEVIGILDMGRFGRLITQTYDSHVLAHDQVPGFLQEALHHGAITDPAVLKEAEQLLGK
jgi:serine/threonine protein kinase